MRLRTALPSMFGAVDTHENGSALLARGKTVHERLQALLKQGHFAGGLSTRQKELLLWIQREDTTVEDVAERMRTAQGGNLTEEDWRRLVHVAITTADTALLDTICEAGMEMNFASSEMKFTSFQLAGAVFDNIGTEETLRALEIIALYASKVKTISQLNDMLTQCDFTAENLKRICTSIVSGSDFPITTSLQVSALLMSGGERIMSRREAYSHCGDYFTRFALHLLHSLNSDHASAVALEAVDERGSSAIEVALRNRNLVFVNDWQVSRVMVTVWCTSEYMSSNSFVDYGHASTGRAAQVLVSNPRRFFFSNRGKFLIWATGFIAFLVLFTWLGIRVGRSKVRVNSPVSPLETIVCIFGFGFIGGEVVQLSKLGLTEYSKSGWNLLDSFFSLLFIVLVITRWASMPLSDFEIATKVSNEQFFAMVMAIASVVLWLRLSFIFIANETLGPFIRMIACFMRDVYVFLYLMLILMIGFGLALNIVVGADVEQHRTLLGSIFTLYQAALGEFDFSNFAMDGDGVPLGTFQRVSAQTLLAVYLACAAIVLVNLLIAMLAETFSSIQQDQNIEFIFGLASMTVDLNQGNNTLPPPFNSVVYFVFVVCVVGRYCFNAIRRKPQRTPPLTDATATATATSLDDVVVHERADAESEGTAKQQVEERTEDEATPANPLWICGRCHHSNRQRSRSAVNQQMESLLGDSASSLQYLHLDQLELCEQCFRLKKPVSENGLLLEQVSLGLFLVFFWLPGLIVFMLPTALHFGARRVRKSTCYKRGNEWLSKMRRKAPISLPKRRRRRRLSTASTRPSGSRIRQWVQLNFSSFAKDTDHRA